MNRKKLSFSKSRDLHESFKLEHFQGGGGGNNIIVFSKFSG